MAQTSVEFIVHELSAIIGPLKTNPMTDLLIVDAIKKAMKMHKSDCENAWMDGFDFNSNYKDFEDYYNQTFNQ